MASSNSSIKGKVVALTGATSGIGYDFAKVLAAAGAKVVFNGRRTDKGKVRSESCVVCVVCVVCCVLCVCVR